MKFFIPIVNTNTKTVSITNLNNSTSSLTQPFNMMLDGNLYSKGLWASHPDYHDLRRLQFHNMENNHTTYPFKFSCVLASEIFFSSSYHLDFYSGQNPADASLIIGSILGNATYYSNRLTPLGLPAEQLETVLIEFTNTSVPTGSYIYNTTDGIDGEVDATYFNFNHIMFGSTYTLNVDLYLKTEYDYNLLDNSSQLVAKKIGGYYITNLGVNKMKRSREYVITETTETIKDELIYLFSLAKTLPFYLFDEITNEIFYVKNTVLKVVEDYAGAYTITYTLEDAI